MAHITPSQGFPPTWAVSTASTSSFTAPPTAEGPGGGTRRWDPGGGEPGPAQTGPGLLSPSGSGAAREPGSCRWPGAPSSPWRLLSSTRRSRSRSRSRRDGRDHLVPHLPLPLESSAARSPGRPFQGQVAFRKSKQGHTHFVPLGAKGFWQHGQLLKEPPVEVRSSWKTQK